MRRKHLQQRDVIDILQANQHIVQALGSRGDNIIEVEFPSKEQKLVLLPAKFNKQIWIKKGHYLLVKDEGPEVRKSERISGTIDAVLGTDDIAQLKEQNFWWVVVSSSPIRISVEDFRDYPADAIVNITSARELVSFGFDVGHQSNGYGKYFSLWAGSPSIEGLHPKAWLLGRPMLFNMSFVRAVCCRPSEFERGIPSGVHAPESVGQLDTKASAANIGSSEDDLSPLQPNTNRPIIEYYMQSSDEEEE